MTTIVYVSGEYGTDINRRHIPDGLQLRKVSIEKAQHRRASQPDKDSAGGKARDKIRCTRRGLRGTFLHRTYPGDAPQG
jgi:hypothetical protein